MPHPSPPLFPHPPKYPRQTKENSYDSAESRIHEKIRFCKKSRWKRRINNLNAHGKPEKVRSLNGELFCSSHCQGCRLIPIRMISRNRHDPRSRHNAGFYGILPCFSAIDVVFRKISGVHRFIIHDRVKKCGRINNLGKILRNTFRGLDCGIRIQPRGIGLRNKQFHGAGIFQGLNQRNSERKHHPHKRGKNELPPGPDD